MTYKYQIRTFQNGLGETVFRAKRVGWLPSRFAPWVKERVFGLDTSWGYSRWTSRDGVVAAIQKDAKEQDESARYRKQKQLKLIIVEDESVEVT